MNPIQSYDMFTQMFSRSFLNPQDQALRSSIFSANLNIINAQNALFLAGGSSFFLNVNSYGDMTFDEFKAIAGGQGIFRKEFLNLVRKS